ncbi:MAG: hypothetical protein V4471_04645 [Pseudomonadota bacterium]
MPNNNNKNLSKIPSPEHWNDKVLPIEEKLLLISPENVFENQDNIMDKLLTKYREGIQYEISLYPQDVKLKTILEERLATIEAYIDLKKHLASAPNNINNDAEERIKNINSLIQQLGRHCQYIQKNYTLLGEKEAPEKHLLPLIFNLIADGFDYLATLQWNLLDSKPKNEAFKTILDVIRYYKACVYCLHEEKRLLPEEYSSKCDEKINIASNLTVETFNQVKELKNQLGLSTEVLINLMKAKEQLINFLRKPPQDSIANLFNSSKQPQSLKREFNGSKPTGTSAFFKSKKIKETLTNAEITPTKLLRLN